MGMALPELRAGPGCSAPWGSPSFVGTAPRLWLPAALNVSRTQMPWQQWAGSTELAVSFLCLLPLALPVPSKGSVLGAGGRAEQGVPRDSFPPTEGEAARWGWAPCPQTGAGPWDVCETLQWELL